MWLAAGSVTLADWEWLVIVLAFVALGALVVILAARDARNRTVRFGFFLEQLTNGKREEKDEDAADESPPA